METVGAAQKVDTGLAIPVTDAEVDKNVSSPDCDPVDVVQVETLHETDKGIARCPCQRLKFPLELVVVSLRRVCAFSNASKLVFNT